MEVWQQMKIIQFVDQLKVHPDTKIYGIIENRYYPLKELTRGKNIKMIEETEDSLSFRYELCQIYESQRVSKLNKYKLSESGEYLEIINE